MLLDAHVDWDVVHYIDLINVYCDRQKAGRRCGSGTILLWLDLKCGEF